MHLRPFVNDRPTKSHSTSLAFLLLPHSFLSFRLSSFLSFPPIMTGREKPGYFSFFLHNSPNSSHFVPVFFYRWCVLSTLSSFSLALWYFYMMPPPPCHTRSSTFSTIRFKVFHWSGGPVKTIMSTIVSLRAATSLLSPEHTTVVFHDKFPKTYLSQLLPSFRLHSHWRHKLPKSDFLSTCGPYLIFLWLTVFFQTNPGDFNCLEVKLFMSNTLISNRHLLLWDDWVSLC